MPIAAAVEGNDGVTARRVLAARDMTSERRCAAALDGRHHLQLAEAHTGAIGLTPSGTVVAEDIYRLFCQLLFTQAFLFKQLRLFERIAERAIVHAAVKVRPAIV